MANRWTAGSGGFPPLAAQHSQGVVERVRIREGRELFTMRLAGPAGTEAPTVVFEGGLAAGRSYWATVQRGLADVAPTVVYDRSGLGRSPADPGSRCLRRLGDDLAELLDQLGDRRFVLVGHSWGGPVVRIAAAARPERIAGLVLVDPTDESCDDLFSPAMRRFEKIGQGISVTLSALGLLARMHATLLRSLPDDAAEDMRREGFGRSTMRTRAAELATVAADLGALRDDPPELGDIPITVISAGLRSAGMNERVRAMADESHRHRAACSPRGRHVVARDSPHMVQEAEPELIAAEIRRLVAAAEDDDISRA